MTEDKKYKKRVIQANSSSEEDNDAPVVKRVKVPAPEMEAAADGFTATTPAQVEKADDKPKVEQEAKPKISIYSTGASSDDDDTPLTKTTKQNGNGTANGNGKAKPSSSSKPKVESDSEEDIPLAAAQASSAKKPTKRRASKAKSESDLSDFSDDEDVKPKKKTTPKAKAGSKAAAAKPASKSKGKATPPPPKKRVKKEDSVDVKPTTKGKAVKNEDDTKSVKAEGEDEDDSYKWWEHENDGTTKWTTLEHSGVLFPPEYEPHGVKMKYDGKSVTLAPEAEEVCSFFAAILETDYPKNPVFVKNFFSSWLGILKEHPPLDGTKITSFDKCDFRPIFDYLEIEKAKKKDKTAAQKKAEKAVRDAAEESYKFCLLDGRKEKVGNFRVEPPGLFRGRGEHPKTGLLKTRVSPEQITINIGKDAKVPDAPAGHKWKSVQHDNTVTWLATWKENINGAVKYVFLAAGSSLKGQSDFKKFEKARALKEYVDCIRRDYTADLKSKETAIRQRATAIYFIDRFALRNGNEKGDDEADTVGCCSLRAEHITLNPEGNLVTFDFLGKDSIRYVNEVKVDEQVFKNLKIFKKAAQKPDDKLFDRLDTSHVNKYLTSYMEGLTAKVFRTYNASWTFVQQLKDTPADASIPDKILAYNRANRMVAVLCNHQRAVGKGHAVAMEKMGDKVRALKYQRKKLRLALLASTGGKKAFSKFKEAESDLEDDWIVEHEKQLVVLEREKIQKKFDKENLKRQELADDPQTKKEDRQPQLTQKELQSRLEAADELEKTLKAERKAKWAESKLSDDRLVAAIEKLDERIKVQKLAVLDKDEGKEISLGTSKINYLDPRITFAWCAKHGVPATKMFSKTLIEKFTWAAEGTDADFDW